MNLSTSDQAEAIRRKQEILLNPIIRDTGRGMRAQIKQFIAYKVAHREFSRNSAMTKIIPLNELADRFPKETAASIGVDQCETFYHELCERVTESTAEGYMMALRSFFRWTVEVKRWRLNNPIAEIDVTAAEHGIKQRFADKALKNRLIENAPNDDLRFILFCGFDAGLRRDEISEARADWFGNSVHVQRSIGKRVRAGLADGRTEREWRPKYNKERVIPLTRPFAAFLKRYLKDRDPLDFALHPEIGHGRWRYRYDFRRPFTDYMTAQGEPWITPHVMRHSFASILKTKGKSIAKIAEWLGDTERVTEKRYAHLKPDDRDIHVLS